VHLVYVDDSGDDHSFALGALIVPGDRRWLGVHDELVAFRHDLSTREGFRMKSELKASQLVTRSGPWRRLQTSTHTRYGIYKAALDLLGTMPDVKTLGVVVTDRWHPNLRGSSPIDYAWERLLERLERFCNYQQTTCMLVPDDGNPVTLRKITRRRRRFAYAPAAYGGPGRPVPFDALIDDPSHRDSAHSYEVQWADLIAYAAFRSVMHRPQVPTNFWASLGPSVLDAANATERRKPRCDEPPGLLIYPDRRRP
jgi:hypothetical protein